MFHPVQICDLQIGSWTYGGAPDNASDPPLQFHLTHDKIWTTDYYINGAWDLLDQPASTEEDPGTVSNLF